MDINETSASKAKPINFGVPLVLLGCLVLAAYVSLSPQESVKEVLATQTSLYKYEIDQCMDDSIKNHRTVCCSDPEFAVMGGIDVVNLFFQEPDTMPIMGDDSIAVYLPTSTGFYKFLFASEDNRQLFIDDPWHYAPTWGGFCAYGIALEDKAYDPTYVEKLGPFIDLSQWTIYNDRLYFFGGEGPKMKFLAAGEQVLGLGNKNWGSYYQGEVFDGHFDTNCFHRQTYDDLLAKKVTGDQ